MTRSLLAWSRRHLWDVLLTGAFLLLGAAHAYRLSTRIPAEAYRMEALDSWFDNDLYKTMTEMTDRFASPKSERHPSFSLLTFPPTKFVLKAMGVAPLTAVLVVNAAIAGLWSALLFLVLRSAGSPRLDASLYTLMGLGSATFIFLFTAAETFALGSVTILACLLWAARDAEGRRSRLGEVVVAAATLGVTVTNWMYGLVSAALRRGLRPAAEVALASLGLIIALWGIQSYAFPDLSLFLRPLPQSAASTFLFPVEAGGPRRVAAAFAAHPIIMPAVQVIDRPGSGRWELLSVQGSTPGSAGPEGAAAVVLWLLLLGGGLLAISRSEAPRHFRALLLVTLGGQLLLHLAYGYETFMYSPHWLPSLLLIAATAARTRWRLAVIGLTLACLVTAGVNNLRQFDQAVAFLKGERDKSARRAAIAPPPGRPEDEWGLVGPWVVAPGMRLWDPAAPEPSGGGGLWPAPNAFYVGFVVQDAAGRVLLASSDTASGQFEFRSARSPSGEHTFHTSSPFYQAEWWSDKPRSWRLTLDVFPGEDRFLSIVLRGVGWRFARIKTIERQGSELTIEHRWRIRSSPAAPAVLGEERGQDWLAAPDEGSRVESELGLGFARLGPLAPGRHDLIVEDSRVADGVNDFRRTLSYGAARPGP